MRATKVHRRPYQPEKFDPAVDQYLSAKRPRSATAATDSIPLLCQEACNLLVAGCRDTVKFAGRAPSAALKFGT